MDTLRLEPFGGLAGDMLLAALLDLRDPRFALEHLAELARALVGDEARLALSEAERGGLRGAHRDVQTPESRRAPHRHHADLLGLLERAPLGEAARARSAAVLWRLAEAEAAVHGIAPQEVHFHEVGAVDTLIDVAGTALALERLGVERVFATPPLVGSGTVRCAHGVLPVPAPATAILLRDLPHRPGGEGERLTPTGAALLAELVDSFDPPGVFLGRAAGYGAGRADFKDGPPNLARVQLGEVGAGARREAWLLEVTLDDTTGEELGFALDELYAAGALEAWTSPVAMKKGRPGVVLSALAREDARGALERVVFGHTPTLGLRWTRVERAECDRETVQVTVQGEPVRVRVRRRPGAEVQALDLSPEHDDLARVARRTGQPVRTLEREAIDAALADWGS
jgi:uncharacterized protein (TIGR00299 family) protein